MKIIFLLNGILGLSFLLVVLIDVRKFNHPSCSACALGGIQRINQEPDSERMNFREVLTIFNFNASTFRQKAQCNRFPLS